LAEWINKEWSRLGGRKTESRNLSTLEILLFPFLIPLCLFLEPSSSEPPEEVHDEEEWEEEEEWYFSIICYKQQYFYEVAKNITSRNEELEDEIIVKDVTQQYLY
ncbi:MAG: hypothetical protein DRN04_16940, partial [Thermoprotei archaeon]